MTNERQTASARPLAVSRLDPRTVPRSLLLERLGAHRPRLSIVLVGGATGDGDRNPLEPLLADGTLGCQLLVAPSAEIADINRATNAALGRLILVVPPGAAPVATHIRAEMDRLAARPDLGIVESHGALIVTSDLWHALGGFDEEYQTLPFALADIAVRARAVGFTAPSLTPPESALFAADAARLRQTRAIDPDRSGGVRTSADDTGRLTAYTAITNRYDVLKHQPAHATTAIEFLAFLDASTASAHRDRGRGWRIVEFDPPPVDPARGSRYLKANAHLATDADYSIWLDASIAVVFPLPPTRLIELFLADADMCVFSHHARRSVVEEAEACKALGLDSHAVIDSQIARYRREGVLDSLGLSELPVILRRHTPKIRSFNEIWWAEILAGSRRDQLSFDYSVWKAGVACARFPSSLARHNGLFQKYLRGGGMPKPEGS